MALISFTLNDNCQTVPEKLDHGSAWFQSRVRRSRSPDSLLGWKIPEERLSKGLVSNKTTSRA
ncbi:hypothetical protein L211DRAFT_839096 [Terfezia boudieri ATCC MYA-4762]|uniref:Uncharacterized protein n=1 Tax=Terfezia boudieri ATCC MYA-4762 TaxID=1051890 RepID=A0A3N4LJP3_9PEZI|nr:hypothetical protein L211DRAFT_839096 [Terfezia boudieri ATCC MYA-4762]